MADLADDGEDFFFVYRRGRHAPQHVTHVRIDESVDEIEDGAFEFCRRLVQVDTHDGIRRIGHGAFWACKSLRRINIKSAVKIGIKAFGCCENLESVEFGDSLRSIGFCAFESCTSLKTPLKLPSIYDIGHQAFTACTRITDLELSERLQTIGRGAFDGCECLQRVAIPLKRYLFEGDYIDFDDIHEEFNPFDGCEQLKTVELVGGVHKTVSSLHMKSWRTEMIAEINRINQVLPTTPAYGKTDAIQQWMELVHDRLDHYKAEHKRYVKEGTTLLELAVWKAKLDEKEDKSAEGSTKKAKVDVESLRKERRVTCGADIVIKNVLPFLKHVDLPALRLVSIF